MIHYVRDDRYILVLASVQSLLVKTMIPSCYCVFSLQPFLGERYPFTSVKSVVQVRIRK